MENQTTCLNCGATFDARYAYCPYCGQANRPNKMDMKFVISEFFSANFNLDSRFISTIKRLLFSPASLTQDFLKGKRTRYTSPVRIYLIISFIYFFILSVVPDTSRQAVKTNISDTKPQPVSVLTEKKQQKETLTPFEQRVRQHTEKLKTEEGQKTFWYKVRQYFSMGMWLLMPLTALILNLLFYKNTFYYEHLIFIIHLQSVWFIISAVYILLQRVIAWKGLFILEILLLLWVTFLWFKRFYTKSTFGTIWKMILFFSAFGGLILLFFVVISLVSILY